jgi:hypothetical protein
MKKKKGIPSQHRLITGREVEEANSILEKSASQFPKDAKEYKAIELAAKALLFAFQRQVAADFEAYLEHFGAELTEEQKRRLLALGIDE